MASNSNNGHQRNWSNVGNKFRSLQSMGKNFQSSMKQTMNGFTGIDKPSSLSSQRSFRSSTMSNDNNIKSPSGARQYQSGRRRSVDRTPNSMHHHQYHGHYKSSSISKHPSSQTNGYKKRRKRSLLIGRESYNDLNSPKSNASPNSSDLPPNFYPPESFVNLLYRVQYAFSQK